MRIALINFPFDNNYGGSIQRYALMKVLTDLGHKPVHLYTRYAWRIPGRFPVYAVFKRIVKKMMRRRSLGIFYEYHCQKKYDESIKVLLPFYNKYVPHTPEILSYSDFLKYRDFDAYLVGSDQIWRRSMNGYFPYSAMFLDFVSDVDKIKRIAYGVSFGTSVNELSDEDIKIVSPLYKLFDAVSVREKSALSLLKQYGWTAPEAKLVLDPTLLLDKEDYIDIIDGGNTAPPLGNMFCYILDSDAEKEKYIFDLQSELNLKPFYVSLSSKNQVSMEQWLRSFYEAEYVVTDSYHGLVFSIIFNKPFKLFLNERRGNDRFLSLMDLLGIKSDGAQDWAKVNSRIVELKVISMAFLEDAL